jgi:hypothetical protein
MDTHQFRHKGYEAPPIDGSCQIGRLQVITHELLDLLASDREEVMRDAITMHAGPGWIPEALTPHLKRHREGQITTWTLHGWPIVAITENGMLINKDCDGRTQASVFFNYQFLPRRPSVDEGELIDQAVKASGAAEAYLTSPERAAAMVPENPPCTYAGKKQETVALWIRCHKFNDKYAVGTAIVRYKLINPLREGTETATRSQAWVMGGHTCMIMIEGHAGGVLLDSIVAIKTEGQQ